MAEDLPHTMGREKKFKRERERERKKERKDHKFLSWLKFRVK